MNWVPYKLAWLEYFRSLSPRGAGGRDFLWMTLLMFFVQLLALVIFAAREGVLERSVDAFLGNKEGYGIPVWSIPNFLGENEPVMISNELLDEIEDGSYPAAPFRQISNGQMIRMPDRNIWARNTQIDELKFAGMAVDFDGPLYAPNIIQFDEPVNVPERFEDAWELVLDKNLFRQFFDIQLYKETVTPLLTAAEAAQIPDSFDDLSKFSIIWLNVKVHRRDQLTPFKVKWAAHFGVGTGNTAYLAPIEFYNIFEVAKTNPKLCAFLEAGPELGTRVRSLKSGLMLRLKPEDKANMLAGFETLAQRLNGVVENRGSRMSVYFGDRRKDQRSLAETCDGGIPERQLKTIATDIGFELSPDLYDETLSKPKVFTATQASVAATCDKLSRKTKERAAMDGTGENCVATIPMATTSAGYSEVFLFAKDRLDIKNLVDFMRCRRTPSNPDPLANDNLCISANDDGSVEESRLAVNRIYEDSLNRFGFLTELLNGISGPIGFVMIGMLAAILWVQLGTVLGHRRFRYAMFLSNGITWAQLKSMILFQVVLGVCISMVFAVIFVIAIKFYLLIQMTDIALVYEKITLGRPVDVLPLGVGMVMLVLLATLGIAVILTLVHLVLNRLSPNSPLERLLG